LRIVEINDLPEAESTLRVHTTPKWLKGLAVQVGGHGVVSHVGSAGLRALAFKTGLTGALSAALRRPRRLVVHDRGQVFTDLAVVIADGGRAIRHIRTLRDQGELFGPVASASTGWRALAEIDGGQLVRVDAAGPGSVAACGIWSSPGTGRSHRRPRVTAISVDGS
jgi:hypothetical protein